MNLLDPATGSALALLVDLDQQEAVLFARKAQALVDHRTECQARPGGSVEFIALDLAIACGIAQSTATHRLSVAEHLVHDLPQTHRLLGEGVLRVGQALVLLEETKGLDADVCGRLEDRVLPELLELSTGDARRLVKKVLLSLDVEAAEARRQQKKRERRAFLSPQPDGQAFVGVFGSAEAGSTFWHSLTALTGLTFGTGADADGRTLDQQRSDLALSLAGFALASRHGHGPSLRSYLGLPDEQAEPTCELARRNDLSPAQVKRTQAVVLVPVQTGLGISDDPAELVGYGPISAAHARDLLAAAELRQACVDLHTGRLVALSDTIVQPPACTGRYWGSAHPPVGLVELDTSHDRHQPPQPPDPPGGPPPAGPPPSSGPPFTSPTSISPTSPSPPPPSRRRATSPSSGTPSPPSAHPLTLYDALQQMVFTPLAAESRVEARHDPSPGLADLVRLRDTRCIGPGCSQPAHACDLEHWKPHPTGDTTADNLGPASRRCHNAKTHGDWTYTPHPDGSITWTSPHGLTYRRAPRTQPVDLRHLARRPVAPPLSQQRPQKHDEGTAA